MKFGGGKMLRKSHNSITSLARFSTSATSGRSRLATSRAIFVFPSSSTNASACAMEENTFVTSRYSKRLVLWFAALFLMYCASYRT